MYLRVDHARQDVQALAVHHLGGGGLSEPADRRNPAIADADVAHALTVLIDYGAGFQNHIKALAHPSSYSAGPDAEEAERAFSKHKRHASYSSFETQALLLRMRSHPAARRPCRL